MDQHMEDALNSLARHLKGLTESLEEIKATLDADVKAFTMYIDILKRQDESAD